jgi:hypothetical protein
MLRNKELQVWQHHAWEVFHLDMVDCRIGVIAKWL